MDAFLTPAYKALFRMLMRDRLRGITKTVHAAKSEKIVKALLADSQFKTSRSIFVFLPRFPEPDLVPVIQQALQAGKKVSVPKVNLKTHSIEAYALTSLNQLGLGYQGILEPPGTSKRSDGPYDLMLIPGLAFDREGRRLGRGEGFFDRYLAAHKPTDKIGIAFREQILPQIPFERHDSKVQRLITDVYV